jgi:hypothetical protein
VPATSATSSKTFLALFNFLGLRQITVLKRQTRQAVCAMDQSILLRCMCSIYILQTQIIIFSGVEKSLNLKITDSAIAGSDPGPPQ